MEDEKEITVTEMKYNGLNVDHVFMEGESILLIQNDINGNYAIVRLWVAEECRRQGIATNLIKKAREVLGVDSIIYVPFSYLMNDEEWFIEFCNKNNVVVDGR